MNSYIRYKYLFFFNIILFQFISFETLSQDFYSYYSDDYVKTSIKQAKENKDVNLQIYWADFLYHKNINMENDTLIVSNLIGLIVLYQQVGLYENANEYLDKAIKIANQYTNPKKKDLALIDKINSQINAIQLKNLFFLKKIDEAKKYAGQLTKNLLLFGTKGSSYSETYTQLARYHILTNNYFKADSLLQVRYKEKDILLHELTIPSEVLKAYAELYFATKNRTKALKYFSLAKKNYVEKYNVHFDLAQIDMNIGLINMEEKEFDLANKQFKLALDFLRIKFGKINRLYAEALSLMAQSYDLMGYPNTNFVRSLHAESLEIYRILKIDDELDYSLSYHRWIEHYLFYSQKDKKNIINYSEIEKKLQKTAKNITNELSKNSIESINASCNIAYWYFQNSKPEKGTQLLLESNRRLSKKVFEQTSFLTENEQIDLINFIKNKLNINHSYAFFYANLFPELTTILYDNFLILKGLLLTSNNLLLRGGKQFENSKIVNELYKDLKEKENELADLLSKKDRTSKQDNRRIEDLTTDIEQIKKDIIKVLPSYQLVNSTLSKNWKNIKDSLNTSETVIEYINFDFFNPELRKFENKVIYCALILRKDYIFPKVYRLFDEEQMIKLLNSHQNDDDEIFVNKIYEARGMIKKKQVTSSESKEPPKPVSIVTSTKPSNTNTKTKNSVKPQKAIQPKESTNVFVLEPSMQRQFTDEKLDKEALYKLIWMPFASEITDIKNIYFSPIGILHKISFSAIQYKSKFLIDNYNLIQLSNSRAILERNKNTKFENNANAVLFGGIDFNNSDNTIRSDDSRGFQSKSILTTSGKRIHEWGQLKGTLEEVNEINKIFPSSMVFSDKKATETEFKNSSSKKTSLMHLATHGFFMDSSLVADAELAEEQTRLSFFSSENPLLRSGLIFAGGNYFWKNGKMKKESDADDGILTALELSNLDLSSVELMVLSACRTGLGDVKNSEGVYGLQRALKMAGVKSYIISLWEVPDKETKELMLLFYGDLKKTGQIDESFLYAQREMRKKYDPYYWAAFVLVK
ncbi:MAG: CHAT domain-containing protein [Cytophagaceae bacterium]|nr:CHAT domain-containing protein [Cytophagaceae bacterium]